MSTERDELAYELAKLDGEGWVFEPPIMDGFTREGHAPEVWQRRADAILTAGYRKQATR